MSRSLQLGDGRGLVLGLQSGPHLVDPADGLRHRPGGHKVIAGQHDDAQARAFQGFDGCAGVGFDWVGHDQQPSQLTVRRHVHHAGAIEPVGFGLGGEGGAVDGRPAHLFLVADDNLRAVHPGRDAQAGLGPEILGLGKRAEGEAGSCDCLGQGVF